MPLNLKEYMKRLKQKFSKRGKTKPTASTDVLKDNSKDLRSALLGATCYSEITIKTR